MTPLSFLPRSPNTELPRGAGRALAVTALIGLGSLLILARAGLCDWRGEAASVAIFAAVATMVLRGLPYHPHEKFGSANKLTLLRAGFVALLPGFVLAGQALPPALAWFVPVCGTVALIVDGLDGWFARRQGLASAFGARFDMEIDALFVLLLSALALASGKVGAWVLASGLLRYAWLGAGQACGRLAAPLPPSFLRKAICVIQIIALLIVLGPPVDGKTANVMAAVALGLLVFSFGRDLFWLGRADHMRDRLAEPILAPYLQKRERV